MVGQDEVFFLGPFALARQQFLKHIFPRFG
jgi:hypothetical protein